MEAKDGTFFYLPRFLEIIKTGGLIFGDKRALRSPKLKFCSLFQLPCPLFSRHLDLILLLFSKGFNPSVIQITYE